MKWRTALLAALRAAVVPVATALVAPAVDEGLLDGSVAAAVLGLLGVLSGS